MIKKIFGNENCFQWWNEDGYVKRIKMKDSTTKFVWDGDNCVGKYTELIEQYHYDSEEEKMEHKIEMELNGWNDSGQVMEMISGSLMPGAKNPPVHVWFGSYYKTIKIEVRNVTRRKI